MRIEYKYCKFYSKEYSYSIFNKNKSSEYAIVLEDRVSYFMYEFDRFLITISSTR